MSVSRLEFDTNNARKLPYTMLGMGNKLEAYQRNLINKRNELFQLKGKVPDEKSLDKRIAYVEGMIDFWTKRKGTSSFSDEDAAFNRVRESSSMENIDSRSTVKNRDFGSFVSRRHFHNLCEYGQKAVLKSREFYHYQMDNTELSRLRKIHRNLHRNFVELRDTLETIYEIIQNPDQYNLNVRMILKQKDFVILLENIQITLPNSGLDIFELKESAQKLMDDNTKVSDNSAWDFIFDFFYGTFINGQFFSRFTYDEQLQQWRIDNTPLPQIFGDITNDHVNVVRLVEKSFSNIIEGEWEESMRPIVGPESLSVQKANFDKEIEIMDKELEDI